MTFGVAMRWFLKSFVRSWRIAALPLYWARGSKPGMRNQIASFHRLVIEHLQFRNSKIHRSRLVIDQWFCKHARTWLISAYQISDLTRKAINQKSIISNRLAEIQMAKDNCKLTPVREVSAMGELRRNHDFQPNSKSWRSFFLIFPDFSSQTCIGPDLYLWIVWWHPFVS